MRGSKLELVVSLLFRGLKSHMQEKSQIYLLAFKTSFESIYDVWHLSCVCCALFRNQPVNNKPNISRCSWYAGNISRAQSEQLLHQKVLYVLYCLYMNNHGNISVCCLCYAV